MIITKDKDRNVETFLELVENKPEKSLCNCNGGYVFITREGK